MAIGGGTGLSVLLRGLKAVTSNITAVVTVADDGGSSGKLRTEMGVPPMGDIRMCMAALADAEPAMSRLLQYQFPAGNGEDPHFAGHAFGNLLIAALTDVNGDFEEAVRQSNRVLAVRGSVVPVAGETITLHAELDDGSTLDGESQIQYARGINHVWITPDDIKPTAEALTAIAAADVVVIGPGSLYTSLMPPLLVPGMREALAQTQRGPSVCVQRRHAGRRNRGLRRAAPSRGTGQARPRRPRRRGVGQQQHACQATARRPRVAQSLWTSE